MNTAFRKVEIDLVLPQRLDAFEVKWGYIHRLRIVPRRHSSTQWRKDAKKQRAAPPLRLCAFALTYDEEKLLARETDYQT
jgi:hypothetical protein